MLAYSAGPFVSVNSFLFYARGLGFITGFEEPDSALLPPSGSLRSSSCDSVLLFIKNTIYIGHRLFAIPPSRNFP